MTILLILLFLICWFLLGFVCILVSALPGARRRKFSIHGNLQYNFEAVLFTLATAFAVLIMSTINWRKS